MIQKSKNVWKLLNIDPFWTIFAQNLSKVIIRKSDFAKEANLLF